MYRCHLVAGQSWDKLEVELANPSSRVAAQLTLTPSLSSAISSLILSELLIWSVQRDTPHHRPGRGDGSGHDDLRLLTVSVLPVFFAVTVLREHGLRHCLKVVWVLSTWGMISKEILIPGHEHRDKQKCGPRWEGKPWQNKLVLFFFLHPSKKQPPPCCSDTPPPTPLLICPAYSPPQPHHPSFCSAAAIAQRGGESLSVSALSLFLRLHSLAVMSYDPFILYSQRWFSGDGEKIYFSAEILSVCALLVASFPPPDFVLQKNDCAGVYGSNRWMWMHGH